MAKMRGIKPETFTDSKILRLSPLARWLFVGMWTEACDNGHVDDDEIQLKVRILPADNVDIAELLDELISNKLVVREHGVLHIPNLRKHQRIDLRWFKTCDFHDCHPPSKPTPKPSTQRAHDVATAGPQRAHDDERRGDEVRGSEGEVEGERRVATATDERNQSPEITGLCNYLADWVETNGSKKPTITKTWRDECRRMIDIDKRTPDQIRATIDWSQQDPFWKSNILSMPKLRAKYDQLRLQAQRQDRGPVTTDRMLNAIQIGEQLQAEADAAAAQAQRELTA